MHRQAQVSTTEKSLSIGNPSLKERKKIRHQTNPNATITTNNPNLHRLPRTHHRPPPPNRNQRPLPRLLPPTLRPRTHLRILLPSLLGRPPSLRSPLRPHPRPRPSNSLQPKINRVRLPRARASLLLAHRSATSSGSLRSVCRPVARSESARLR
jgi:hypothetical protein